MTSRAWLLLLAAALAGVAAALLWPAPPGEQPIRVPDRTLVDADLAAFTKVCDQLRADSDAVRVSLPAGQTLLEFATYMSHHPTRIAASCERAGTTVADFLAIVVALGEARRVDHDYQNWEARLDARLANDEATAQVLEAHGHKVPPPPDPDAPPPWWNGLSERTRANRAVWQRHGADVDERWAALMRTPPPDEGPPSGE